MARNDPLTVEVTRGGMVESRHRGDAVVVDAAGAVVHAWGSGGRVVYPRSAIKPLQALALVETGAADACDSTDAELALAAASHGGGPAHTDAVARWLDRLGLDESALECGAHAPLDPDAAAALAREGRKPGPRHNNCSGKHAGMLATALHRGEATAGYSRPDHPVQARLKALLAAMGGEDLARAPQGTDGCGIPVWGMTLAALARACARMADPDSLAPARADAARRVLAAMAAHPAMVAWPGRLDAAVLEAGRGGVVVKTGAEGMYAAVLPALGLGAALKIEDGAGRASPVAMAAVLTHLGALDEGALRAFLETPVTNALGDAVGAVRMAAGWDKGSAD